MKYIKKVSIVFLAAVFSFSCGQNSFSPTQSGNIPNFNSNKETEKTTTESSTSVRYDDLPDGADYVAEGRKWNHKNLTYYFSNGTGDISGNQEQQAIADATDLWEEVSGLTFREVSSASQVDIIIKWATGSHGDGSAFDGRGGVLAHAFYPPPNGTYAGDSHFDDAETWTLSERSSSSQPMDLTTVAAHELGHSLGLGHSQVQGSLMYAYYDGSHRYLSQDDIDGIQNLYGPPPLEVTISGPSSLSKGQQGTWSASVSDGDGNYSYEWYYRSDDTNNQWDGPVSYTDSYSTQMYDFDGYTLDIRVDVSDGSQRNGSSSVRVTCTDCDPSGGGGPLSVENN
ncbi:M10 family metallopeptidase domain-containing protein [Fodinibius saliphilus]|uniref:M10 family metallopeptidase domain-containing protein n=1 Tax=Fodinibius saliphilus TaxID=1920650 RepID=UPI00110862FE|nr:M10 family metallopeptidase domain-containing protein [Fodinibius saliphilus]